jgi:hypothetical protein
MPLPLDWQTVADRLKDFPRDNYTFIGSVMKGTSLFLGSYVLLEFHTDWKKYRARLLPWCVALLAILVTYTTWGRGVLLTNSHANLCDNVFPLAMGIIEVLMFGILNVKEQASPDSWLDWPFLLGVHAIFAVALISNRLFCVDPIADFDAGLRPLAHDLVGWVRADAFGASGLAILAFAAWTLLRVMRKRQRDHKTILRWQNRFAIFFILLLSFVVWGAEKQRAKIDEFVSTHAPPATAPR